MTKVRECHKLIYQFSIEMLTSLTRFHLFYVSFFPQNHLSIYLSISLLYLPIIYPSIYRSIHPSTGINDFPLFHHHTHSTLNPNCATGLGLESRAGEEPSVSLMKPAETFSATTTSCSPTRFTVLSRAAGGKTTRGGRV